MRFRSKIILLTAASIAIALLCVWVSARNTPSARCARAMRKAFARRRLVEPRLSGDVSAAKYWPRATGERNGSRGDIAEDSVKEAYSAIAENKDDTSIQYARARLLIADGKAKNDKDENDRGEDNKGEEALDYIRKVAAARPGDAEVLNDLGVCLFTNNRLEEALKKFEEALTYDPRLLAAQFNRALCHKRLLFRNQSATEFTELEKLEKDKGWLEEVSAYKRETSAAIEDMDEEAIRTKAIAGFNDAASRQDLDAATKLADEQFESLLSYGRGQLYNACLGVESRKGVPIPSNPLDGMKMLGAALFNAKKDRMILDLWQHLASLSESQRDIEHQLRDEYLKIPLGSEIYPRIRGLARRFLDIGNKVAFVTALAGLGNAEYKQGESREALTDIAEAQSVAEKSEWPWQQSWLYGVTAQAISVQGQDLLGIDYCEKAIAGYERLHLPAPQAKIFQTTAFAHQRLGDFEKAIAEFQKSTELFASSEPRLEEIAYNCVAVAEIYQQQGNHELALLAVKQAHSYAMDAVKTGSSTPVQSASLLAVEQAEAGRSDLAQQSIGEAFESERKKNKKSEGSSNNLELLIRAAETSAKTNDTNSALGFYNDAEKMAALSENRQDLLTVLRSRAQVLIGANRKQEAEADLRRALIEAEMYRSRITNMTYRSSFLAATQDVFDALVSLYLSEGRSEEAFDFCEKAHARTMLEQLAGDEQPLTLKAVQSKLSGDINVLLCSVTSAGVNLFLVKKSGMDVGRSDLNSDSVAVLVGDYLFDLRNKGDIGVLSAKASNLYEKLIKPIEPYLDPSATLCIVPDKALHFLPFSALIDSSGHYFVETRTLIYAPSASVLTKCLDQAKARGTAVGKMLAVGNPAFDAKAYPNLRKLRDSEDEARDSAKHYRDSLPLVNAEATEERVREEMKTASVIHIASHCKVEAGSPWLVLAPSPGRSGRDRADAGNKDDPADGNLYLDEVYKLKLQNAKLVVLSSCESALGRYYRGEGIVSLVRPFIAAGVPQVVASLWSVDSSKTSTLMTNFHKFRTERAIGPGDALREAQRRMIDDPAASHPYFWAAFIAVGSN
ncbi:MAG: hypothetical protein DMF61_01525 [Blastocatellia bacterium AA13]|nr:MAG: hypothetical protein DMF61_01525 [Blastocatellia bacterium AA13]